jgi:hypothetical protein
MELTVNQKVPKSSKKYTCNCCDYYTSRLSQYERHLSTDKHKKHDLATLVNGKSTEKVPNSFFLFLLCKMCEWVNDFREKHADKYTKLIIESMGGLGEDEIEKENKIMHKLAKEITLDK